MAIKSFIFCDRCNQDCIRAVDRRWNERGETGQGRRSSDDRSWFESANIDEAPGWQETDTGQHLCPRCNQPSQ